MHQCWKASEAMLCEHRQLSVAPYMKLRILPEVKINPRFNFRAFPPRSGVYTSKHGLRPWWKRLSLCRAILVCRGVKPIAISKRLRGCLRMDTKLRVAGCPLSRSEQGADWPARGSCSGVRREDGHPGEPRQPPEGFIFPPVTRRL